MTVPNRNFSSPEYRYGFQGQEKDDEIKGNGNSINYKYRMHDPRVGRFFATDPLSGIYPWNSPYAFSENRVIDAVELEGLEASIIKKIIWHDGTSYTKIITKDWHLDLERDMIEQKHGHYFTNHINWETEKSHIQFAEAHNDKHEDVRAGTLYLTIDYTKDKDNRISAYFGNYASDRKLSLLELAKEKDFQNKKWGIYIEGVADMGIGAIGIITASFAEIESGGLATTMVITQLTLSIDELSGGINKLADPRKTYDGIEAKPIKYLVGEFLGENGKRVYDVIDITLGGIDISKADKLIDVVGVYDTVNDAIGAVKDEIDRHKKDEKEK